MVDDKTALVIDDDPDIRELLCVMLETEGFRVDVLSDGIDALDLSKWYDVILLDLRMPIFDGQRLTDYWQFTNADVLRRVILLSGYSGVKTDQEPVTFARVAKPFIPEELMSVVAECVEQSDSLRAGGNRV